MSFYDKDKVRFGVYVEGTAIKPSGAFGIESGQMVLERRIFSLPLFETAMLLNVIQNQIKNSRGEPTSVVWKFFKEWMAPALYQVYRSVLSTVITATILATSTVTFGLAGVVAVQA